MSDTAQLIQLLIQRMAPRAAKREKLRDTVDLIFALTSMAMLRLLAAGRLVTSVP